MARTFAITQEEKLMIESLESIPDSEVNEFLAKEGGIVVSKYADSDSLLINKLFQPDGTNPFVYTDNSGGIHLDGDIYQEGTAYDTHAEEFYTTKDLIITRDGAIAGLSLGEISGLEVLKYDGANSLYFGADLNGYFKVGEAGDLQILATREDTPEDGGVAFWDDTNKRFDTDTGFIWDDTNKSLDIAGAVKIAGKLTGLSNGTANSDAVNFSQLNTKLNTSDFGTSFDTAFSGKSTSNLTEGTNLYYTEARVSANTTVAGNLASINTLNGAVGTAGSVLKMIKDNSQNATFTNTTSGLSATTIVGAINEIEGRVDTVQTLDGVKVSKLFQPNGTNPLIGVDNSGNVGIGTTSPDYKLQIAGDLNIANNEWFSALDYAGTGVVNMFKVNEDNEIDVGGTLNIGTLSLSEDSGAVTLINMPVSATPTAGDEMSYSFSLDSNVVAKVYAEADGSGGIQNPAFQITGDLTVSGDVTITGDITGNNLSGTNTGDNAVNSLYSGLVSNVTTNLSEGTATATTVNVNSSDGTNATLVSASTTRAGLLTKAKYNEIVANTAKVGITTAQASAITANTAKISYDSTASTKLGTIETNADVTDTTNVTAAGALMKTGGSITGNLSVSGNIHTAIKTITSTTSLSVNDANMVVCNSSSDFTITLPTVTTGITYMIKNINTGTVTIDGYSTQLIDDNSSIDIKQWESVTLVSNGTIWLIN